MATVADSAIPEQTGRHVRQPCPLLSLRDYCPMSATDTAVRVLDWALRGSGPPPRGDLRDTLALVRPSPVLQEALAQLAAVTTARLRLTTPAFGTGGRLGVGEALLAAGLGALTQPAAVQHLLPAAPPATEPCQWLLRHGLLLKALPFLPPAEDTLLLDTLLTASPLTALLTRPPPGRQDELIRLALDLLDRPGGRRWLQLALAEPVSDAEIRRWRQDLLERLRLASEAAAGFVLDVYETLLIHYAEPALRQVRAARQVLASAGTADPDRLQDALSVAGWWQPLWALARSHPAALRERRYLGYDYREGLALYRLALQLGGTTA